MRRNENPGHSGESKASNREKCTLQNHDGRHPFVEPGLGAQDHARICCACSVPETQLVRVAAALGGKKAALVHEAAPEAAVLDALDLDDGDRVH